MLAARHVCYPSCCLLVSEAALVGGGAVDDEEDELAAVGNPSPGLMMASVRFASFCRSLAI